MEYGEGTEMSWWTISRLQTSKVWQCATYSLSWQLLSSTLTTCQVIGLGLLWYICIFLGIFYWHMGGTFETCIHKPCQKAPKAHHATKSKAKVEQVSTFGDQEYLYYNKARSSRGYVCLSICLLEVPPMAVHLSPFLFLLSMFTLHRAILILSCHFTTSQCTPTPNVFLKIVHLSSSASELPLNSPLTHKSTQGPLQTRFIYSTSLSMALQLLPHFEDLSFQDLDNVETNWRRGPHLVTWIPFQDLNGVACQAILECERGRSSNGLRSD